MRSASGLARAPQAEHVMLVQCGATVTVQPPALSAFDESVDLPTELEIDAEAEGISDPQAEVADWLSDRYGWCVNGFSVEASAPTP